MFDFDDSEEEGLFSVPIARPCRKEDSDVVGTVQPVARPVGKVLLPCSSSGGLVRDEEEGEEESCGSSPESEGEGVEREREGWIGAGL